MKEPQQGTKLPVPTSQANSVMNRAYRRSDYDYISRFNLPMRSGLMSSKTNTDLFHHTFDRESHSLFTESSLESGTIPSFASSTSFASEESYTKNSMEYLEAKNDHHRPPYLVSPSNSLQMDEKHPELHVESKEKCLYENGYIHLEENTTEGDKVHIEMIGKANQEKMDEKHLELPVEMIEKAKQENMQPTVLPKFGDWETSNPSAGHEYTVIFKKLRDEKKLGTLPMSPSSTNCKIGLLDLSSLEDVKHEPEHPIKARQSKSLSSKPSETNRSSQQKKSLKWSFCCTSSVVD